MLILQVVKCHWLDDLNADVKACLIWDVARTTEDASHLQQTNIHIFHQIPHYLDAQWPNKIKYQVVLTCKSMNKRRGNVRARFKILLKPKPTQRWRNTVIHIGDNIIVVISFSSSPFKHLYQNCSLRWIHVPQHQFHFKRDTCLRCRHFNH